MTELGTDDKIITLEFINFENGGQKVQLSQKFVNITKLKYEINKLIYFQEDYLYFPNSIRHLTFIIDTDVIIKSRNRSQLGKHLSLRDFFSSKSKSYFKKYKYFDLSHLHHLESFFLTLSNVENNDYSFLEIFEGINSIENLSLKINHKDPAGTVDLDRVIYYLKELDWEQLYDLNFHFKTNMKINNQKNWKFFQAIKNFDFLIWGGSNSIQNLSPLLKSLDLDQVTLKVERIENSGIEDFFDILRENLRTNQLILTIRTAIVASLSDCITNINKFLKDVKFLKNVIIYIIEADHSLTVESAFFISTALNESREAIKSCKIKINGSSFVYFEEMRGRYKMKDWRYGGIYENQECNIF